MAFPYDATLPTAAGNRLRELRGIGLSELFDRVASDKNLEHSNYPPYNMYSRNDENNTYVIDVAVAGFAKEDIIVTVKENSLYINGSTPPAAEDKLYTYLHNGLAMRDFRLKFAMHNNAEVVSAKIEHGILRIEVELKVPEKEKPIEITIS